MEMVFIAILLIAIIVAACTVAFWCGVYEECYKWVELSPPGKYIKVDGRLYTVKEIL